MKDGRNTDSHLHHGEVPSDAGPRRRSSDRMSDVRAQLYDKVTHRGPIEKGAKFCSNSALFSPDQRSGLKASASSPQMDFNRCIV